MFLPFVGLSFVVYIVVILGATLKNTLTKRKHLSAFQSYGKEGGWFADSSLNQLLAYTFIVAVAAFTGAAMALAFTTAAAYGVDEPQVMVAQYWFAVLLSVLTPLFYNEFFFVTVGVGLAFMLTQVLHAPLMQVVVAPMGRFISTATASLLTGINMLRTIVLLIIGGTLFALPVFATAQIVEPGFESEVVTGGLALPTATAFTPDGRIFIAEKNGAIKVFKNGALLPTPLITLTDINTFGDRGLIGMALDPNFASNGYLYLSYSYENTPGVDVGGPKTARIVRVTVTGDTASESSKVVLVGTVGGNVSNPSCEDYAVTDDCIPSDSNSHSAGGLAFGPDGKLYASLGDGADFAAVDSRALRSQNIDSLAGKVLRINTDGTAVSDNPFYNGDPNSNRSKVYAYGFRNMFRINFNPATGKLYGGDVGWSTWEEVNEIIAGANYGWPCREGVYAQPEYNCAPSSSWTNGLYSYQHNEFGAGAITVGAFPSSDAYPDAYDTSLFIGDYAQMWLKRLVLDGDGELVSVQDFEDGVFPVEVRTGLDGNIYYLDILAGELRRITHTDGNRRPVAEIAATPTSGLAPLTVSFSSVGTYDPDGDTLGITWNFGDGSFAATPNPTHTYTSNGLYTVTLYVADDKGASVAKSIDIVVGDQAPTATIVSPDSGSFYQASENVMVMGEGIDSEDGTLPASAFDWTVLLHHNTHTHTIQQFSDTKMITFIADNHDDNDVYMEIILTVTDSAGLTHTDSINMYLNNANTEGNLVPNPSLEEGDPIITSQPLNWVPGWYGSMNPTFTYPVNGLSGEKAAEVTVSGYNAGAARWYFSPVFVEAGETYTHSHVYKANVETLITLQYTRSDGSNFYWYVDTLPAVADPTTVTYDIEVPADAQSMTIFHDLSQNGTLTVDEYLLEKQGGGSDTNPPTGSITNITPGQVLSGTTTIEIMAMDAEGSVTKVHLYVDGSKVEGLEDTTAPFSLEWDTTQVSDGQHILQVHMHDVPDNHGLSDPITVTVDNNGTGGTPTGQNLLQNGDFATLDGTGMPLAWTPGGWGSHDRVLTVVQGRTNNAARTEITSYELSDTGDAKWRHDHIPVTPGVEYAFSTYYRSDTISDVIAQYELVDGSYFYQGVVKEVPPAADWTLASDTFIAPENAVSMTPFHLISAEGYLEIDDVSIVAGTGGNTSETNPPYIAWESHETGDVVSGTVTFTASSSDDTGVVGVYFGLNGTFTGTEDFTAPYQLTIDTTEYPNGDYILKATSHDQFGNNDIDEIIITIDNEGGATPPTGDNLVFNGDFEILTNGVPNGWREGGYGVNDTIYEVVTTPTGNNVAYVEIFNYTSGDAKWVFDDVPVVPGETYEFSVDYASQNNNEVVAFYTLENGETQAELLGYSPAYDSADPSDLMTYTVEFTAPADADTVTVFHTPLVVDVNQSSYGYIDNVSLTGAAVTPPPTGDNLITNGDLSVGTTNAPAGWAQGGWGTNTRTFTYPVTGQTGNGARVAVSSYTSGDAKWYFTPVSVIGGETYQFSHAYQSDVASEVLAQYTMADGSFEYEYLAGLAPSAVWATNTGSLTVPADATAVTIFHTIAAVGTLTIDEWELTGDAGEPIEDTTAPAVNISNVSDGDVLSGLETITVAATDAVGVTEVMLLVDGVIVGADTTAPYQFTFNTNTVPNGVHAIRAEAEDAAGNTGVSDELLITVDNDDTATTTPPTGDNLVTNGDFTAGDIAWAQGGWGTNTADFSITGGGARVEVTAYTSGDAKWYFADVPVVVGETYSYSNTYTADVPTDVTVRYTDEDGDVSYDYLAFMPAAPTGAVMTPQTFTIPAGVVSVTVFHTIAAVGTLDIDDVSLIGAAGEPLPDPEPEPEPDPEPDPEPPATTTISYGPNLVENGDFTAGDIAWAQGGWGTNTADFSITGGGARVEVTAYTSGDAKWYFTPVAVGGGAAYQYDNTFTSNVETSIVAQYELSDGSYQYAFLGTIAADASGDVSIGGFETPADVVSVTVFHILNDVGYLEIDNVALREIQ